MNDDDALIDRVARDMTDAGPPAGFEARVLRRLPARRDPWMRVAIPAAAAAGLVVGLALPGALAALQSLGAPASKGSSGSAASAGTPLVQAGLPATPDSGRLETAAHRQTAPAGPASDPIPPGPATPGAPAEPAEPAAEETADPDEPAILPPLAVPAPIVIDPIQPILPTIAPITVDPIVRSPLPLPSNESKLGAVSGGQRAPGAPTP
jgi:hypothetical protein